MTIMGPNPEPPAKLHCHAEAAPGDLKQLLVDIQNQVKAAALRHDDLLAQLIDMQKELREEMSCMRSKIEEDAPAQKKYLSHQQQSLTTPTLLSEPSSVTEEGVGMEHTATWKPHSGEKALAAILGRPVEFPRDTDWMTIRERGARFLRSKEFEMMIAAALICNTMVMCCESQYFGLEVGYKLQYFKRESPASSVWPGAEDIFSVLAWTFGTIFMVEFLLKLMCWRLKYFCSIWNWIDFACILVSMLDTVAADLAPFNPHLIRLIRLVRLGRLVRLIRFLESLEALYIMTTAILGLSRSLGWAIFLLSLILLTCDLFVVQLLHSTYFSDIVLSDLTEEQKDTHRQMYAYFGTVSRCLLSMFEITLGNWTPIARMLSEEVSQWFIILCLAHKLTVGFAVVGVITGVILQETFKVAQTDDLVMLRAKSRQSAVLRRKLENLFGALDSDKSGQLSFSEFEVICEDPDIRTWLGSLDIETDDLPRLFKLCNFGLGGDLSKEQLLSQMPRIRGVARSMDVLSILHELKDRREVEREATRYCIDEAAVLEFSEKQEEARSLGENDCLTPGHEAWVVSQETPSGSILETPRRGSHHLNSQTPRLDGDTLGIHVKDLLCTPEDKNPNQC